jgi:Fe-S-cluster containining protein
MVPPEGTASSAPDLDVSLLSGFAFSCLPGCGLCCFTSPRLDSEDEIRLRARAPRALIVIEEGERRIAARPDGGACQFLTDLRCGAHDARPAPCREFPISVHIGARLQATVVLSCPGLRLDPLDHREVVATAPTRSGLEEELSSVRRRLTPVVERRRREAERRRRKIARDLEGEGRWVDEEEVRKRLTGRSLLPKANHFSVLDPPSAEEGLEWLPFYYDRRPGPVALAEGLGGWEALELAPTGGSRPIGLAVPPDRYPALDPDAEALLSGYLRYWVTRDSFLAAVHFEMLSTTGGNVLDQALEDLWAIGSSVIARGAVRAKLAGADGVRLTRSDIELGIRATDQDWLDRPTWGSRL